MNIQPWHFGILFIAIVVAQMCAIALFRGARPCEPDDGEEPMAAGQWDAVYRAALRSFGPERQGLKAIEEMAELQRALARWVSGQAEEENIIEELADVQIMLDQMVTHFGVARVGFAINRKAVRLKGLVKKELSRQIRDSQNNRGSFVRQDGKNEPSESRRPT